MCNGYCLTGSFSNLSLFSQNKQFQRDFQLTAHQEQLCDATVIFIE